MLSKEEFIRFIVDDPEAKIKPDKNSGEPDSALPEGFGDFGFDPEDEAPAKDSTDTSFARNLLIASGFGDPEHIERSEVILSTDAAAKHLPDLVYYWPKSDDRPYQTLLFELEQLGSEVLKTSLFKKSGKQQLLEDALSRFVQHTLRGFEKGGERRTASVRQGAQSETLCIISVQDDREHKNTRLVCFGTKNKDHDSLETFHIREEAKLWEPQIKDDHLAKLYDRHFKKLASDKWQNAFISKEERKLARKLLDTCIDSKATEHEIEQGVVNLLEEIAGSYGLRRKGGKKGRRLKPFQLPNDHDIGSDPEKRGGHNPFKGMTLRDEKNRLLGYIIYCLDEKQDAAQLRDYLKQNNRFHNVLVIYPDGNHAELELWQGKTVLPGKLLKDGARYSGEGEVVNLLSRFFVVSKAKVKNPVELAEELAYRARYLRRLAIKELAENREEGPLRDLYTAFKETLVHDQSEEEFADAFAQTLTYGLLTSRWMGSDKLAQSGERFTRQTALKYLPSTSNFLKELFETALSVKLDDQRGRLLWLVDDIANLLDRIDVTYVFGEGDRGADAATDPVIHFYEPFLAAYDNELRNKRGVYFTPMPVVSFIVRSVHEALQKEFGLKDGLASTDTWGDMQKRFPDLELPKGVKEDDFFVCILDPATGTGTFLYECIEVIERTMKENWCNELNRDTWDDQDILKKWREYVFMFLLPRLYGYELMIASYSIAHLKLVFKLKETGYTLKDGERLKVFLTNSLEPPTNIQAALPGFTSGLAQEAMEVNIVKRSQRFSVVVGNPPYAGFSSNASKDSKGNFSFIGNLIEDYKMVDGKKLDEKKLWLQDDYVKFYRFGQYIIDRSHAGILAMITNHGFIDNPTFRGMRQNLLQSFPTVRIYDLHGNMKKKETTPEGMVDQNVFDIQQGVSISLMSKALVGLKKGIIKKGDLFGDRTIKYESLQKWTMSKVCNVSFEGKGPFYLFIEHDESHKQEYDMFYSLKDITKIHSVGVVSARDKLTIAFTPEEIWERVNEFVSLDSEKARTRFQLRKDVRDWKVALAQDDLRSQPISRKFIKPILYRPFDIRFTYYTGKTKGFIGQPATKIMRHMIDKNNIGIMTTRKIEVGSFQHAISSNVMTESHSISLKEVNYLFPLFLHDDCKNKSLFENENNAKVANINADFLKDIYFYLGKKVSPVSVFRYIYSVLFSKNYRTRYFDFFKRDFPHIPLTKKYALHKKLSEIGKKLIGFHNMEDIVRNKSDVNFHDTSGGEIVKITYKDGSIFINKKDFFSNINENEWDFNFGSYQVLQKWLKDRKGRKLSRTEVEHYLSIISIIKSTILLMEEIDKVIDQHGGWPGAFVTTDQGGNA